MFCCCCCCCFFSSGVENCVCLASSVMQRTILLRSVLLNFSFYKLPVYLFKISQISAIFGSDFATTAHAYLAHHQTPVSNVCETAPKFFVLGLHLCTRNLERATIGLLKEPLPIYQSFCKEIRNTWNIWPGISILMKFLRWPLRDYIFWYNLRELRLLALI